MNGDLIDAISTAVHLCPECQIPNAGSLEALRAVERNGASRESASRSEPSFHDPAREV